ncbi:MAG TPA: tetratricopeptide repeat protein [Pyrinomonadaceae bacterium]|nr:tetratricopeptide repeat protein [Pyrinomonadaceae bacterium]
MAAIQEPAPDDPTVRAVISRYFDCFARKDLPDLLKLWSSKAPDPDSRKEKLEQLFAANDKIEVRNLTVRKVIVAGDQASARIEVEIEALDAKTGKPADGLGHMHRVVHLVMENGAWMIRGEVAAEQELAEQVAAANSEAERGSLLATEKDLLTSELARDLVKESARLARDESFDQALSVCALALTVFEGNGDKPGIALSDNVIGNIHNRRGEYALALEYYDKSLTLRRSLNDKLGIGQTLGNVGFVYYSRGDYGPALDAYRQSLALKEAVGDKRGMGNTLNNMGITYDEEGDYSLAVEYYEKSLAIRETIEDKQGVGETLNNLAVIYDAQRNYGEALEYYQKSLKLREEFGTKIEVAQTLNNIGLLKKDLAEYDAALDYYRRSLALKESLKDKIGTANTLNNIGVVYELEGKYSQAEENYQNVLKVHEEAGNNEGIVNALTNLASVRAKQGNYADALKFADRAAVLARRMGQLDMLRVSLDATGDALRHLGQPDKAKQAFEEAIATIEKLRSNAAGGELDRQRLFEGMVSPYYEMVDLLVAQGNLSEALSYAERAKGRVLLDVLRGDRVNITKAMSPAEREQERKLIGELVSLNNQVSRENAAAKPSQTRLADLNAQLEKARVDQEAFQTNLYASHPELKVQRGQAQPLNIEQAGALVANGKTALLEYAVTDDNVHLFVLTKSAAGNSETTRLDAYTVPLKRQQLADRTEAFRRRLANHDLDYREVASELYNLLIKPAQAQLKDKTMLVIVPDDVLWEVPFQALAPAANRYLIEDYAISYAPSLTVLHEMIKKHQTNANRSPALLAVGNPSLGKQTVERTRRVLMDEQLEPLPEAERQVKALGQLYGAAQSKVYIGAEAREDRVKAEAGQYRILQLATHGILNNANPMYSHVVLSNLLQPAGDPQEDGLLEAWEIMNLNLNADMVVLSACDTARGRIGAGEGVIGLSWAFFVAGSPTTVVSQWSVESASTTELMLQFHRNLKTSGNSPAVISKAESLRRAQLQLLRDKRYQHPFFWAGFVVIGDGF